MKPLFAGISTGNISSGARPPTHVKQVTGDLLAVGGEVLQLLNERVRDLLAGLDGSGRSGAERGVYLRRLGQNLVQDGIGGLDQRGDSLHLVSHFLSLEPREPAVQAVSKATHGIVDALGLLHDNEVLGGRLERVREGRLGSVEAVWVSIEAQYSHRCTHVATARPSADSRIGLVREMTGVASSYDSAP